MFTMHGTTMIFFVAIAHPVRVCPITWFPLMIGAQRTWRFPTGSMPSVFWLYGSRRISSVFQFLSAEAVSTALGSAPDVGMGSPYASLDLALRSQSGSQRGLLDDCVAWSRGSAASPRRIQHHCNHSSVCAVPGMKLSRMPACLAWLKPGSWAGMVYPGRYPPLYRSSDMPFDRPVTLAGTSSIRRPEALQTLWMHFFLDLPGIRKSYVLDYFRPSPLHAEIHSQYFSRKPIFG